VAVSPTFHRLSAARPGACSFERGKTMSEIEMDLCGLPGAQALREEEG
jgi:hypothetical protein